jgi:hypothetical protein
VALEITNHKRIGNYDLVFHESDIFKRAQAKVRWCLSHFTNSNLDVAMSFFVFFGVTNKAGSNKSFAISVWGSDPRFL